MILNTTEEEGFTLVEVLVAFAIFSIVMVTVINLFIESQKTVSMTKGNTVAIQLAQSKMEEYLAGNITLTNNVAEDNFLSPYANYRWRIEKSDVSVGNGSTATTLDNIHVTISWSGETYQVVSYRKKP